MKKPVKWIKQTLTEALDALEDAYDVVNDVLLDN